MNEQEFPQIDPRSLVPLRVLAQKMAENPAFLDDPECPYSDDLKAFLAVFRPKMDEDASNLLTSGDKWGNLETASAKLFMELQEFKQKLDVEDVAEHMSYFRTSTALLEKLISLNERAGGLKRLNEFQEAVLEIMETTLTASQRLEVMNRLREFTK